MPTISMFYGILVLMYFDDIKQHHSPHIHVQYQNDEASISIPDGEVLSGSLPRKQLRLVQAWVEIHQDELLADWKLAIKCEPLYKIEPLK
jgi:Domain of unknown function (DUF4160)